MTAQDRFERTVASWLRDDAMPASPDQLEALLVRLDTPAAGVFLVYVLYLVYAVWWLRSLRRLNAAPRV